jgi:Uma2 family endonuclease
MDSTVTLEPEADTFAAVLHNLGDVPPHRVLMRPYPATEEDVVRLAHGTPRRLCELVDGVLVEKALGYREAMLAMWIGTCLNNFVRPRKLGYVAGADALMRIFPGIVRLPDVSYVAKESLPTPTSHQVSVAEFSPDVAVEVLSESNTKAEIARKRQEYFAAGTKLMWVFDTKTKTVTVFSGPKDEHTLSVTEILDGGRVLSGFQLPVSEVFAYLDELPE